LALADRHQPTQAYRNRSVASSNPARGTIIKLKNTSFTLISLSDDPSWSTLDEVDQKIIAILNKNARTPSKEIAGELRRSGVDVSDRTIRKRIERLEKNGIIKGYKAVLSGVSAIDEFEALFLKLKITRSITNLMESIKSFVKTFPNYLFVATLDGDWNMIIVMRLESSEKNPTSKVIEKFSEQISDYRISGMQMKDVNLLNMSLLLLS
jgi:DNA-binding Lrp family transcriptional regulator